MSDTVLAGRLEPIDRPGLVTWSVQSESDLSSITNLPDGSTPLTGEDVGRVAKVTGGDAPRYFELAAYSGTSGGTWHEIGGAPPGGSGGSLVPGFIQGFATTFVSTTIRGKAAQVGPGSAVTTDGVAILDSGVSVGGLDGAANQYLYMFRGGSGPAQVESSLDGPARTSGVPYPHLPGSPNKRLIAAYFQHYSGGAEGRSMDEDGWLRLSKPIAMVDYQVGDGDLDMPNLPPVSAAKRVRAVVRLSPDFSNGEFYIDGHRFRAGDSMEVELFRDPEDGTIPLNAWGDNVVMTIEVSRIMVDRY